LFILSINSLIATDGVVKGLWLKVQDPGTAPSTESNTISSLDESQGNIEDQMNDPVDQRRFDFPLSDASAFVVRDRRPAKPNFDDYYRARVTVRYGLLPKTGLRDWP
jgi:hypothetical protein